MPVRSSVGVVGASGTEEFLASQRNKLGVIVWPAMCKQRNVVKTEPPALILVESGVLGYSLQHKMRSHLSEGKTLAVNI